MGLPWESFDAEAVEETSNEFTPIPDKTKAMMMFTKAERDTYNDSEYFNVEMTVQDGPYNGRRLWSRIDFNKEPDKAQKKLARVVKAAGLVEEFKKPVQSDAEIDAKFQAMVGKSFEGTIGLWELDDKSKSGNWLIAGVPQFASAPTAEAPVAAPATAAGPWAG